jgi:hypothetical protein
MRRLGAAVLAAISTLLIAAGPILACGGLIGPNGAVNLLRTTTFVGYHEGVEHYVTAFQFAGGEGAFGSLTPLPGVPSDVVKGGDWTLQRLILETNPPVPESVFALGAARSAADEAQVLMRKRIDALDITILKGGAAEVGLWARNHGFRLPPDAPEVLAFYAERSPIFMAAAFDADAARERGQSIGDGTPIHVTIPTPNPWVPLRILALGKNGEERIEADLYLLTDRTPAVLPGYGDKTGLFLDHSAPASDSLLADLRSDRDMGWVPSEGWLTKVRIDAAAADLRFDLAIDATGQGAPSRVAAGLDSPVVGFDADTALRLALIGLILVQAVWFGRLLASRRAAPA